MNEESQAANEELEADTEGPRSVCKALSTVEALSERPAVREQQQVLIAQTALAALRDTDLQRFMDQVVHDIQQTLGTDSCSIHELQPGGHRLLLRAHVDSHATANRSSATLSQLQAAGVSGTTCAIRVGDRDYGVLGAHTVARRVFTPDDAAFLQSMAVTVGSAIEHIASQVRMALDRDVARILAQPGTAEAALARVLHCLTTHLPIAVAEAWWAAPRSGSLSRALLHATSPSERDRVERALNRTSFVAGDGVVGRGFMAARASCYTDLGEPTGSFAHGSFAALGFSSALVFPVQSGGDVLGVVTLFSKLRLTADDGLLRSLDAIGCSLGEFTTRRNHDERVQLLAAITESSRDAIVTYGADGVVTGWLSGAEDLFGYTAAEMLGQSIERIVAIEGRDELWGVYARIQQGDVVDPFDAVRVRKNGERVEVSVRTAPVRDLDGDIVGVSSTERDLTRLKQTERRLVAADEQKNEFLAMLAHELRNPLAAVCSAADLLSYCMADDRCLRRTQAILARQSAHMSKLLDDLLDVARMIRGKIRLEREAVELVDVCREVVADTAQRAAGQGITVRMDAPSQEIWVEGDRVRLVQIIDNLLSNAVKYTDDGGSISIAVSATADAAVVDVRDTGVGIDADSIPHIFEAFHQADESLGRVQGGLGLGLALVRSLVELHHGTVAATSDGKHQGAEFVVRLPLTHKRRSPSVQPGRASSTPLRILLIEDNDDAAEMMCLLLERAGHDVRLATRGDAGISMAEARAPDVILCDVGLPGGLTGLDVARRLRGDPHTQSIPMVAMTGYGAPLDKQASEEAGFDVHLTKPVDAQTLQRVLATIGRPAR